ncbi:bifunctional 5,10-methylenetetrahydrofolate dehydrogenase/5,10-methenyltetrahydrofolate cyclohydrolase [Paucilactobacillus wasatchensis]|uniref:Bifunctional protein FolD n=1 Tax=Paucilactobacillus wasatchensis TaxID=1335616 RepID=A0A0D1A6E9_9LACO|nr:tetrahydrofolate dehydrogenase/cyclohydrolase catalytic domain-containing protein [Paucilactobacillus wasatchensis]KIS03460.1 Methylenetetrahydrofolate dehydrogenase (NADP+) / Methenyltetrahydrofolate cyclohydrolase [Paucilactobacillus wasatchensis]
MTTIIDGKKLAQKINLQTTKEVAKLKGQGIKPGIAVILVGDDPASKMYTRNKQRKAEKLGMNSILKTFPSDVSQQVILDEIKALNSDDTINAILVQAPLPQQIDADVITSAIVPSKDVDGFHPQNLGRLYANQAGNYPVACTPKGIMTILKEYHVPLVGQHAVIVGRSILVGKPMAALLLNEDVTVTVAGHHTKNLASLTKQADILIVATGVGHLIKAEFVKPDAVVIDVGIDHDDNGKLIGDVDFDAVKDVVGAITPVPGGVGPLTIATLMQQTVELTKWSQING